jgi:hypothetical protein
MPFFTVALLSTPWAWATLRCRPLFWLGVGWTAVHFAVISRFPIWWGGATYGPRFFTDVTPGLLLIALEIWRAGSRTWPKNRFRAWVAVFLMGGGMGLFMHSYQGLFNPAINQWYRITLGKYHHERFFDWHHPVFLHRSENNFELEQYWKNQEKERLLKRAKVRKEATQNSSRARQRSKKNSEAE